MAQSTGRAVRAVLASTLISGSIALNAQQVTLPLAQYEALRAQLKPVTTEGPQPPAPYAFEADELEITAGPRSARLVESLTLTLFSKDWQAVPLRDGAALVSVELGDLDGRIDASAGTLVVRGVGTHHLRLESVVPLTFDVGATRPTWRFAVKLPPAALVRGRLMLGGELGEQVEQATLAGGTLQPLGGRASRSWKFAASPGQPLDVRLLGKATLAERSKLPLRFEATSASTITLSRTELTLRSWVEARVAQGQLRELLLDVPESLEVVGVEGPVAGWGPAPPGSVAAPRPGRKTLTVTPLEPAEGSFAVNVELSGPPRDRVTAAFVEPRGASHTVYLTRAELRGDGVLEVADAASSRPAEGAELALLPTGTKADRRVLTVTDPSRPPEWQAAWSEGGSVLAVEVDTLWVSVALGEAGSASYQLWARVSNRGAAQLDLRLPDGFTLSECARDGIPVRAGEAASPAGAFAVPLLTREAPQLIYLAGIVPLTMTRERGELSVPLPVLSAPAARVEMRVLLPGGHRYELADASRSGGFVSPPTASPAPQAAAAEPSSLLAILVEAEDARGGIGAVLPPPAGFTELTAHWTALTAAPAPLAVRVRLVKEKESWF